MKQELTAAEQRLRRHLIAADAVDDFAECLIAHEGCCEMRSEALQILDLVGITETEYVIAWAQGLYSA